MCGRRRGRGAAGAGAPPWTSRAAGARRRPPCGEHARGGSEEHARGGGAEAAPPRTSRARSGSLTADERATAMARGRQRSSWRRESGRYGAGGLHARVAGGYIVGPLVPVCGTNRY